MNYKSKYTASEIDARLSQVFDSTLQTKAVEVSEDTTIKADEGFLGLKEVSVKVSGGGGGSASGDWYDGYYLLDWGTITNEEGYDRAFAKEIIQTLDFIYYLAYRMPSGAIMTTNASIMSDEENWGLDTYKAMRWKRSETSMDAEIGNMSPKDFLVAMSAEYPFLQVMANKMTECTKEEFYTL